MDKIQELKKQIINKINNAKTVYVYNGYTDFYFKTTKADLLYIFKKQYKSTDYEGNQNYLLELVTDYNDRATLNDDGELMFD